MAKRLIVRTWHQKTLLRMDALNLSQRELASILHYSESYISKVLRGDTRNAARAKSRVDAALDELEQHAIS